MEIRLSGILYNEIMADLQRPHPYAFERIGFALGRMGTAGGQARAVLLTRYLRVPDEHYLDDPSVGARLGPQAMTAAMQAVYHGRVSREGIFHIHLHTRPGEPRMSATDRSEIPALIPGFQAVGREAAHGIVILSPDHAAGWIWTPGSRDPVQAEALCVIGAPIHVFRKGFER